MAERLKVVRSRGGEYAIWPADRENPLGWNDAGKAGDRPSCEEYIAKAWDDLRSLGVRERATKLRQMEQKIRRDSGD